MTTSTPPLTGPAAINPHVSSIFLKGPAMSDAISDAPLPRTPISTPTEPAAPPRARKRDTILFATTALVVAGVTAGFILRHRIEPLVDPLIAHLFHRHVVTPTIPTLSLATEAPPVFYPRHVHKVDGGKTSSGVTHTTPHDKTDPAAASSGPADLAASSGAAKPPIAMQKSHQGDHPAGLAGSSLKALVDLQPGSAAEAAQHATDRAASAGTIKSTASAVQSASVRKTSTLALALRGGADDVSAPPGPVTTNHQPMIATPHPAHSVTTAPGSVPAETAGHETVTPNLAASAVTPAQTPTSVINALLHPPAPVIAMPTNHAVQAPSATILPSPPSAPVNTGGPATLVKIAHPVEAATHLVASPLTPKSEIPVLSMVSQLGVLVAQLRDQNEALAHQVATLQATTTRRLDSFSRTLHLDQAKSALALAVKPAEAPRAAIHPHIFQSHSAVPAGTITASSYRIEAASPGVAILSHDGQTDEVSVGDAVPGVGRVLAVTEDGMSWVVRTTHGVIR